MVFSNLFDLLLSAVKYVWSTERKMSTLGTEKQMSNSDYYKTKPWYAHLVGMCVCVWQKGYIIMVLSSIWLKMAGSGLFLLGMARRRKDLNFLGLEINSKVICSSGLLFAFFFFSLLLRLSSLIQFLTSVLFYFFKNFSL